jgi:ferredoxin--NADP+ reductase
MNAEAIDTDSIVPSVVVQSERITPADADEVRRLVLGVDDPAFRVRPGQNIGVLLAGDPAFGNTQHIRRYSVTDVAPMSDGDTVGLSILVRRCFYLDEVSGERYPGIASNFLCDAQPGQPVSLVGPYKNPFKLPDDPTANLLLIGSGTGIAPFRTMIQEAYRDGVEWQGSVRLFYGARTGMETLYRNQEDSDLALYYDKQTFEAFNSVASRPLADERDALQESLSAHLDTVWELMTASNTYVYLSGLRKAAEITERVLVERAGGAEAWSALKMRLIDEGRWSELLYS